MSAPPASVPMMVESAPILGAPVQTITVPTYTLNDCVMLAYQRQPTIAAARASLQSSEVSLHALMQTRHIVARLAVPDLEFRKQQAMKGVAIAQAELNQAHIDTAYNVQRNYWSAVYAKEQLTVADETIKKLRSFLESIKDIVKEGGNRKINANTIDTLTIYLAKVEEKREEAASGVRRAMAALREAIGIGADQAFEIADTKLPRVQLTTTRDQVVTLATTRRAEVIQAGLATEVFRLEVCAQGAIRIRPATRTVAMGADLHVKPIPLGSRGAEYRPDAIGLEMPPAVVGTKEDRMAKVQALSQRADAVYAKTQNLITLEAENAYLVWEETQKRLVPAEAGYKAAKSFRKRSDAGEGLRAEEMGQDAVMSELLMAQALSGYNDALYQAVLAITSIERVTAGGIKADYTNYPSPTLNNGNGNGNGNGEEEKKNGDDEKKKNGDDEKKKNGDDPKDSDDKSNVNGRRFPFPDR